MLRHRKYLRLSMLLITVLLVFLLGASLALAAGVGNMYEVTNLVSDLPNVAKIQDIYRVIQVGVGHRGADDDVHQFLGVGDVHLAVIGCIRRVAFVNRQGCFAEQLIPDHLIGDIRWSAPDTAPHLVCIFNILVFSYDEWTSFQ